jgi:hypothetical protein
MNDNNNLSSKNASTRRTYHRRNRKGNRTNISPPIYLPLTTTIVTTTNSTLIINSPSVPINDLFAPISYLTQYKYVFLIGLSLLILLCVISIVFLIFILKCSKRKSWKTRRQERLDKKRLKDIPDFLDDQHEHKDESEILLEQNSGKNSLTNNMITTNGMLHSDNISNTFSLDPMLEQKIIKNNPPNAIALSPMADDTSLDTLRGSLISSPSQQISVIQPPHTPTRISAQHPSSSTTTDSIINPDERAFEAEKDDDLHDLDLKRIQPRYIKATNNSSSNLPTLRPSGSSLEQTIRKQERRAEEEERGLLHGSNSNLYEKELRRQAEQDSFARKQHTNSQVSLVSRTSEDSCY